MKPFNPHSCDSVKKYEKLNRIGEGTYGVVYRAREKSTGEIVALKRIRLDRKRSDTRNANTKRRQVLSDEGFPITALREILLLQKLSHGNIINLREVVVKHAEQVEEDVYFLVFDYCENDLGRILDDFLYSQKIKLRESEVKCIMMQIFSGLEHLHSQWVIHRDLKVSNLLYNSKGEIKIADFGLARRYGSPLGSYTARVVTLWYRAPELLLRDRKLSAADELREMQKLRYSTAVDLWSAGCIFAELLLGKPLLPGENEIDQLHRIFDLLGTPNDRIWPDASQILDSLTVKIEGQPYNRLRQVLPNLGESGIDLLDGLLAYDPARRYTAADALKHEYFVDKPFPLSKLQMPTFPPNVGNNGSG